MNGPLGLPAGEAGLGERTCRLCRAPAAGDECYARFEEKERPVCRSCWEQILLQPARVLRQIEAHPLDRTPPAFPALRA